MKETDGSNPSIIAICGKGGVGKTSISAVTAAMLAEDSSKKVLAIDADPAVGLALALGFRARRTVDGIRNDLIARVKEGAREDLRQMAEAGIAVDQCATRRDLLQEGLLGQFAQRPFCEEGRLSGELR